MFSIGLLVVVEPKLSATLDQTKTIPENTIWISKTSLHLDPVVSEKVLMKEMVLGEMVLAEVALAEVVLVEVVLVEVALAEVALVEVALSKMDLRAKVLVKGNNSAFHAVF